MELLNFRKIGTLTVILGILISWVFSFSCVQADEMSFDHEFLFVEGKVSEVFIDSDELRVKPNKGKSILILVDSGTVFTGEISSLEDIKKKNQVKVWYLSEEETNRAIKIEKVAELGC